jgi:hypothetical protein
VFVNKQSVVKGLHQIVIAKIYAAFQKSSCLNEVLKGGYFALVRMLSRARMLGTIEARIMPLDRLSKRRSNLDARRLVWSRRNEPEPVRERL